MDWDGVAARWKQASGKIKEKWSRLTDEDLKIVGGDRERLERKIQECYGFAPDHVRKEIEDWMRCQPAVGTTRRCRKTKLASVNSTRRRRTQAASGWPITSLFAPGSEG